MTISLICLAIPLSFSQYKFLKGFICILKEFTDFLATFIDLLMNSEFHQEFVDSLKYLIGFLKEFIDVLKYVTDLLYGFD